VGKITITDALPERVILDGENLNFGLGSNLCTHIFGNTLCFARLRLVPTGTPVNGFPRQHDIMFDLIDSLKWVLVRWEIQAIWESNPLYCSREFEQYTM
jgi:hypothetical protein